MLMIPCLGKSMNHSIQLISAPPSTPAQEARRMRYVRSRRLVDLPRLLRLLLLLLLGCCYCIVAAQGAQLINVNGLIEPQLIPSPLSTSLPSTARQRSCRRYEPQQQPPQQHEL